MFQVYELLSSKFKLIPFRKLSIPFANEKDALIAKRSLSTDKDPKGTAVSKEWTINGNILEITVESQNLKLLRTVTTSLYEMLIPVIETLGEFQEDHP